MSQYKCKICGYVFDEDNIEEGLNIPNGTKFEDLPASFKCPKCRMAKSMFEKIDYYVTEEFEELPEDFKCPMCGATADMFEKVD